MRSYQSKVKLNHRLQVAWGKFHQHRKWILDSNIPVGLRLRFFDAVVSPGALYSCAVLALNSDELERFDIVQRKMLRSIVGWRRIQGEEWECTMRRMKSRVQRALEMHAERKSSRRIMNSRWNYALHVNFTDKSAWTKIVCDWNPLDHPIEGLLASRSRGRPRTRWDDDLHFYCQEELDLNSWTELHAQSFSILKERENDFIEYCFEC